MGRRDWAEVVEQFEQSGLTQRAFAERRGLPLSTLQSWIYRARRQRPASAALLPVRIVEAEPASAAPIELELPSGARLRFAPGTDPAYLARLLQALT